MKKLCVLCLVCVACVWAADSWTTKPFTEWTTKDLQKLMSDSPWARKVDVEMGVRMPPGTSQSEGGGRGGRGKGGGGTGEISTAEGGSTSGADLTGTRGGGGPGGAGNDGPMTQALPVMLVWQTALPVKQALVKAKFRDEAGTSAEAKAFLEREEQYFVLNVGGLPGTAARAGEGESKAALLQATLLSVKGKDPIHAVEVQFTKRERVMDALFFFPRAKAGTSEPLSADDKELEFSTKFDKLAVKYKFKLKDMVFHGKLEL